MTDSRIDELVAGLAGVRAHQVPGPETPGAQALLVYVKDSDTAADVPEVGRARPRYARFGVAAVATGAIAATALIALNAAGPGALRTYANAAVAIQHTQRTYKVHVKDVYADQREFHQAFAKVGLNVNLEIVPASPARARKLLSFGGPAAAFSTSMGACPPGPAACPFTFSITGDTKDIRTHPSTIEIGRTARPGERYDDARPQAGDHPADLHLTGKTVAEARADLRRRHLGVGYLIGSFKADGQGACYNPPSGWRAQDTRRVTGAWARSSDSVTLLVGEVKGDPNPLTYPQPRQSSMECLGN